MSDVFISHVEEDAGVALEIALGLEEAGYTTWCYEVDNIPGPSYLIQTGQAVEQAKALVLVISPHSLGSRQVTKEVIRAHETDKEFIPVLQDITHVEFQNRQPEWREALGAASSIRIPKVGVADIIPRIIIGLKASGILPRSKSEAARIKRIHQALNELQGYGAPVEAGGPPVPTRRLEPEPVAVEKPPAATARTVKDTGRRKKWLIPALIAIGIVVMVIVGIILLSQVERPMPKPTPIPAPTPTPTPIPMPVPTEDWSEDPDLPVIFPDNNLDAVIRAELGKAAGDEINAGELAGINNMDASRKGIINLRGIEYCTNLHNLHLSENQISDISPLSSLVNLKFINLGQNPVKELSPLTSLTKLTYLNLDSKQITDISPLSNLTNLTSLNLHNTQITDISPLSNLTNLTYLNLGGNQIVDVSPLSGLASLTGLILRNAQITDISPLSSLTNLYELNIGENQITDISPLSNLTNLYELVISGNQITDISPLSGLTQLSELYLEHNHIESISALSSLTELYYLCLNNNEIIDISPLVANIGLAEGDLITLKDNPLSSLSLNTYIPQLKNRGVAVELD